MIEFTRILCPIDFSESSIRALAHAAAVAKWYDAHLTVLHVVPTFDPLPVRGKLGETIHVVMPASREEVQEELDRVVKQTAVSTKATPVAVAGDTQTAILDQTLSTGADLIVMGTHGRRGFRRLLLGSVTEAVLPQAPCPVLTVPPRVGEPPSAEVTFKRILCPVDFSPSALQAVGFAIDLGRQAHGRVTLMHVLEWLPEEAPRTSVPFSLDEYRRALAADAEEQLRGLIANESQTWVDLDPLLAFGKPYREVLRAAETVPADLIVMGAQGRGGVGLALFGSTTQQVVRSAACPVLTVRGPLSS